MSKPKRSITVTQFNNGRFNPQEPTTLENHKYIYKVDTTKNTIEVNISQYLTPDQIEDLIGNGVDVTVKTHVRKGITW